MLQEETIAISTQDHKLASLFFDRIIPLHSAGPVPESIQFDDKKYIDPSLKMEPFLESAIVFAYLDSLPESIRSELEKYLDPSIRAEPFVISRVESILEGFDLPKDEAFSEYVTNTFLNVLATYHQKKLLAVGIHSVPIYYSRAAYQSSLVPGKSEALEVVLSNVPLINTEQLEWRQILELRRDEEFKRKMRRFRLFINDNYQGKDKNYIRDSLLVKIESYEEECKKHGLTLVTSSLTQLLDSKSLLGSLGIAATALLTGNPTVAGASLITGSVIEVGKIVLHITEKQLEFKAGQSEISYLIELRKLTSKG